MIDILRADPAPLGRGGNAAKTREITFRARRLGFHRRQARLGLGDFLRPGAR